MEGQMQAAAEHARQISIQRAIRSSPTSQRADVGIRAIRWIEASASPHTLRLSPIVNHLLVPMDGSILSEGALRVAVALALKLGAKVSVFYALPTAEGFSLSALPPFVDRTTFSKKRIEEIHEVIAEQAKRYLQSAIARPQPRDGMGTVVEMDWEYQESDHPYLAILTGAEQLGCDLIVMASHGRRGLEGSMLGSQTQKVLNHSTIPVLVVPPEVAIN